MSAIEKATDEINQARTGELQNHQVSTINEQIVEHDMEIAADENAIDVMQNRIKELRRDIKRRERAQAKLRQQRDIFARAAFELKQVGMP